MSYDPNAFSITPMHAPTGTRRKGLAISPRVRFIVAHDTGNPGATASGHAKWYRNDPNPPLKTVSSAHSFVDDKSIVETIPAFAGAEQALHVLYNRPKDNELYNVDANRGAIGVEYCFGGAINADEAYRRYVWVLARLCAFHGLDPARDVVGHLILDPGRKSDPDSGLQASGRSYERLLDDVVALLRSDKATEPLVGSARVVPGIVSTTVNLVRRGSPSRSGANKGVLLPGTRLTVAEIVTGERVSGNAEWCALADGDFCWSGGCRQIEKSGAASASVPAPTDAAAAGGGFVDRAVAVALEEWKFFGRQERDLSGTLVRAGGQETVSPFRERVGRYWREGTNTHGLDGGDTSAFWSATFISYLMRRAGAGPKFRYSTQHSVFISQAIRDRLASREAGYWGYELGERQPNVGDIICCQRGDGTINFAQQNGGNYSSHTDLVVSAHDDRIEVIGGNVGNSATRCAIALKGGFVNPGSKTGQQRFAILGCRLS
jgi:hypothetical protein